MDKYTEISFSYRGRISEKVGKNEKIKKTFFAVVVPNQGMDLVTSKFLKFARQTGGKYMNISCGIAKDKYGKRHFKCGKAKNYNWAVFNRDLSKFTMYRNFAREMGGELFEFDCYYDSAGRLLECIRRKKYS